MRKKRGFTLIEIIIVLSIIGIISLIAIPVYRSNIEKAKKHSCKTTGHFIKDTIIRELTINGTYSAIEILNKENNKFMYPSPLCPSGGEYEIKEIDGIIEVVCSIHGKVDKLTPLGNNFKDIHNGFIDLVTSYYDEKNHYPRSWGNFKYTDLGLKKEDFENPVEHIHYTPKGDRLALSPEEDYEFVMTLLTGETEKIKHRNNWDIVYEYSSGKWFYKNIAEENEFDINSLVVKKGN